MNWFLCSTHKKFILKYVVFRLKTQKIRYFLIFRAAYLVLEGNVTFFDFQTSLGKYLWAYFGNIFRNFYFWISWMGSKMSKVTRNTFFQHFWAVYLVTKGNVTDFFFTYWHLGMSYFRNQRRRKGSKMPKITKMRKLTMNF